MFCSAYKVYKSVCTDRYLKQTDTLTDRDKHSFPQNSSLLLAEVFAAGSERRRWHQICRHVSALLVMPVFLCGRFLCGRFARPLSWNDQYPFL